MLRITRSTTCNDLGLVGAVRCDGCYQRSERSFKSESENKARKYRCKRYFSDKHNTRKISKRGKTQGQSVHERAWAQLTKRGHCEPTAPAEEEEEEQPQLRFEKTTTATMVQTEKEMASFSNLMVKQTRQQMIVEFIDSMSCKHDLVMLIDKLLSAIGFQEEDVIDLTNIPDTPHHCDPSTTAAAIEGLCNLDATPKNMSPTPTENVDVVAASTLTDNSDVVAAVVQRDVVDAAHILYCTSQSKGTDKFNGNRKLRTVQLDNGIEVPSVPRLYDVKSLKKNFGAGRI